MSTRSGTLLGLKESLKIRVRPSGQVIASNLALSRYQLSPGVSEKVDFTVRNCRDRDRPGADVSVLGQSRRHLLVDPQRDAVRLAALAGPGGGSPGARRTQDGVR